MLFWYPTLLCPTVFPPFFLGIPQAPMWRTGWISVISSNACLVLSMYDMYSPTDTQFQNFAWLFKHRLVFSGGSLRYYPLCFSLGTPFPIMTCSFCLSSTPLILHFFFISQNFETFSLLFLCAFCTVVICSCVSNFAFNYKVSFICVLFLPWFCLSTAFFS